MTQLRAQLNELSTKYKEGSASFAISLANRDKRIDELSTELRKVQQDNEETHDAYGKVAKELEKKKKFFTIEHTNALNKMFKQVKELCIDLDSLSLAAYQALGKKFTSDTKNTPIEKEFGHSLAEFESKQDFSFGLLLKTQT